MDPSAATCCSSAPLAPAYTGEQTQRPGELNSHCLFALSLGPPVTELKRRQAEGAVHRAAVRPRHRRLKAEAPPAAAPGSRPGAGPLGPPGPAVQFFPKRRRFRDRRARGALGAGGDAGDRANGEGSAPRPPAPADSGRAEPAAQAIGISSLATPRAGRLIGHAPHCVAPGGQWERRGAGLGRGGVRGG